MLLLSHSASLGFCILTNSAMKISLPTRCIRKEGCLIISGRCALETILLLRDQRYLLCYFRCYYNQNCYYKILLLESQNFCVVLLLRTCQGRFKYQPGQFRAFGMLAGGSGITPMFQVCLIHFCVLISCFAANLYA